MRVNVNELVMWNVWDSADEAGVLRNRHPRRRDWANDGVADRAIRRCCDAREAVDYCFWQSSDVRYVADRLTWWFFFSLFPWWLALAWIFYEFLTFLLVFFLFSSCSISCFFQQLKTIVTDIFTFSFSLFVSLKIFFCISHSCWVCFSTKKHTEINFMLLLCLCTVWGTFTFYYDFRKSWARSRAA